MSQTFQQKLLDKKSAWLRELPLVTSEDFLEPVKRPNQKGELNACRSNQHPGSTVCAWETACGEDLRPEALRQNIGIE